jgi:hypothetical protein
VPQVAVLFSTAAHYRKNNAMFGRDLARINGALQALLESQQSVEVLGEHHLLGRMAEYPLLVVPELEYLEAPFREGLIAYVKSGGNLLLIGPKTAALFQAELGLTLEGAPLPAEPYHLAPGARTVPLTGQMQVARLGQNAKPFGALRLKNEPQAPGVPAASVTELGRGRIAAVYFSFGQDYVSHRRAESRQFLDDLARQLFPKPMVEVRGSPDVDVVVNRIHGRLAVNLVNTAGPHADPKEPILESIPAVGPLAVTIRQQTKPKKLTLQPANQTLAFTYRSGEIHTTLPRLEIHDIIVVE